MKRHPRTTALSLMVALALASQLAQAAAVSIFGDNFEGTLSQWSVHNSDAFIAVDPLRANNHVLDFSRVSGGFSATSLATIHSNGNFTLSFDYLGLARPGSVAGDLGGSIGIIEAGEDGSADWLGGTGTGSKLLDLVDDGRWHAYAVTFASTQGKSVQLVLRDASGSRGVAGDAYFDNIVLQDAAVAKSPSHSGGNAVPEPSSMALTAVALMSALGLALSRRPAA